MSPSFLDIEYRNHVEGEHDRTASAGFRSAALAVAIGALGGCSSFKIYDGGVSADTDSPFARDAAVDNVDTCQAVGADAGSCQRDVVFDDSQDAVPEADTGSMCGADSCAAASSASCDLGDGLVHTIIFDQGPDVFPFDCVATSIPGPQVLKLTLSTTRSVTLALGVSINGAAAAEMYTGIACDSSDSLPNSCFTSGGTGVKPLGNQPPGTYYVVVKAWGSGPVSIQARLI